MYPNREHNRKGVNNDQFGFRRNKGTREVILSLKILLEKQI
jgi:hypothetical protein